VRLAFAVLGLVLGFATTVSLGQFDDPAALPVSVIDVGPTDPFRPSAWPEVADTGGGFDESLTETPETNREFLRGVLDDGFGLESCDGEYALRFHILNQVDFKVFEPNDQNPAAQTGLYIPRTRVYFEGQLTEPYEYEVSLQRSLEGQFDLLDANFTIRLSEDRMQVTIGRFLVPYSYAWYDHLEQYFLVPERGLLPLNLGLSRATGGMLWGTLGDGVLQYAFAGIDGRLTGLADNGTTADGVAYLNLRPFLHASGFPALKHLNLGGSLAIGEFTAPADLLPLRTSVQASENDESAVAASAIFLEWNEQTKGLGDRLQGALHAACYSGPWTFEGEWQAARVGLTPNGTDIVYMTASGFHAGVGRLLTGETVEGRKAIEPLRPIDPRRGWSGCGAIELLARYSELTLSDSVFDHDLSDRGLWSNRAYTTDVGMNWYWNRFLKWTFVWQHAGYGSPVLVNEAKERFSRTNDLFWLRGQLYF
jgi:phosphate-selective porin OprO/OprP